LAFLVGTVREFRPIATWHWRGRGNVLVMDDARVRERPVAEQRLAVDIFLRHQSPDARVAGIVAIVVHYKIIVGPNVDRRLTAMGHVEMRVEIGFLQGMVVESHYP